MGNPQADMIQLYQRGLASVAEATKAYLECAERVSNQQLAAVRGAIEELSRSRDEIRSVQGLEGLLALQSRLAGRQLERQIGLWSGLLQAASESQLAIMQQIRAEIAQVPARIQESLQAAGGSAEPVMDAMHSVLASTSSAYAMGARAAEEASKLAAAQASTAEAAVRYAASQAERASSEQQRKRA